MKRLYSYLIKSFIGPFILTFFVCIFILLMQFLWRYLDELVGKGLETSIIIELMSYAAMNLVPMALPLSVLMASVMTFGNLGERLELLAIKSSGVSLLRIMKPLIFISLAITIIAYLLANDVIPVTNKKFASLLHSIRTQRPEMIVKEGVFSNEIDGYSIKVDRRSNTSNLLYGIMIYDHSEGKGNVGVTIADSGYINMSDDKRYMIVTLFSGESYTDAKPGTRNAKETYPFRRERFSKEDMVIAVKDYDLKKVNDDLFKDDFRMLKNNKLDSTIGSLKKEYADHEKVASLGIAYNNRLNERIQNHFVVDSLRKKTDETGETVVINFDSLFSKLSAEQKRVIVESAQRSAQANQRNILQSDTNLFNRLKLMNRHIIEWHRKYTLSLACTIFFFMGAPLGAIIRKGGFGTPVVASILLFISYYVVSMIGENVAKAGVFDPGWAMWFSTFFFMVISIFLTHQAVTDSLLLSKEAYGRFFGKITFLKNFFVGKEEKQEYENPLLDK